MKYSIHLPIDQIQVFTGSHWTLSLSTHLSCIALYAQAGVVVIGFGKMILIQVVKIGSQIFGPYCTQIDDGFFKMSRGWIQVWRSKDRQLNKLWWLADRGIDYFKCIYDLMLEAHRTTCSKMKRQEIMMGENKVTVWPSPCCLRGGEGPHSKYFLKWLFLKKSTTNKIFPDTCLNLNYNLLSFHKPIGAAPQRQ